MSFLKVENLTVDYESIGNLKIKGRVLNQINFDIRQGEIFGILGPTGCGKTVLLKTISGIIKPDSGRVLKNVQDLYRMKPCQRGMSLVFQNYALYPHFSAGGNIGFPLLFKPKYKIHPNARVEEVAKLLHIDHEKILTRKPKFISGGEKQRVAVGKAIAALPELLLLDEPLSNVDAHLRGELRYNLRKLIKENGLTAIYVTHDQRELSFVSDRIAVMHEGRILQVGTYNELYHSPKSFFVSLFVGEKIANSFNATQAALVTNGKIKDCFTIRPEFCSFQKLDSAYAVTGTVELVEPYFNERKKLVFIQNDNLTISALSHIDTFIKRGDKLTVYIPKRKIKIFPNAALTLEEGAKYSP